MTDQVLSLPWIATHRRRHSGAPGVPPDMSPPLQTGEIVVNEADAGGLTCWLGVGDNGSGLATSEVAIAGPALFSSAILGALLAALPTTPPSQPGQAWLNGGVLQVS